MKLSIVGGVQRAEGLLRNIAEREGHDLDCHDGDLSGRGASSLRAFVERADVVIVVTAVNSHGAVWLARRLAHRIGKRCLLFDRLGAARFVGLLRSLRVDAAAVASG